MKIRTLSIVAGSEACNARCPFCVSKMTPPLGVELCEPEVNWRNFKKACRLAKDSGVTTAMLTGKGEPTLFPAQITKFLDAMAEFHFPMIELQTNGILLAEKPEIYDKHLTDWYEKGLTTIAVSIVHYDPERNRRNYVPYKKHYIDLPALIKKLHGFGFTVRLTCIAVNGNIDSREELERLIAFTTENKVEQLTITPVNKPEDSGDGNFEVWQWTKNHHLTDNQKEDLMAYLEENGTRIMRLSHGAIVYDVKGQNVCLNNCLSVNPDSEELRNLIFFPDGHVRYYWQHPGSIIF